MIQLNKKMKPVVGILVFIFFGILLLTCTNKEQKIPTLDIAQKVLDKGLSETDPGHYTGSLLMHGMSEYAVVEGSPEIMERTLELFHQFKSKEIEVRGNFISYEPGGSGAAYLSWLGSAPVLDEQVAEAALRFYRDQKRTQDGLMTALRARDSLNQVFIDVAFAVTPYLLYSGLKMERSDFVDYAVFETLELFRILEDKQTGLLHQARGYNGLGSISEDNWSRGNGWGTFALAILVRDLPESHPKHPEVVALAKRYFEAVLRFQNHEGLWHQEMTDTTSYVETSGSGLMLYGLGIMLEKGHLDKRYVKNFERGLQGYTSYIGSDGSVSHTCRGCLSPGKGTKEDYKNREWIYNDPHAFGPVVLAFTQAARMGIAEVKPLERLGLYAMADSPDLPRTHVMHARGSDLAWENDRIAFRVFGPEVRDKVGSGIDVWAKSVNYPILGKWYRLNAEGKDYHTNRGEGCDFYDMGRRRGCGALALWVDEKPYPPETYDAYRITTNQNSKLAFELDYLTWNLPHPMELEERRTIEMGMGTNLFKVTSTFKCGENRPMTVALGLSAFGKAELFRDEKQGLLYVWEQINPAHGSLGTAILFNPDDFTGFANHEGDEFILINVQTNVPFSYYAGAGWDNSNDFQDKDDWHEYLMQELKHIHF